MMPTARWDRPQQLFGYLEEEERGALEPLLGLPLYEWLCGEYRRLRETYTDITAVTVRANREAKADAKLAHADVTERLEQIQQGKYREIYSPPEEGTLEVPEDDMRTIALLRICQQIEFYRMLSHKSGLLTVSFNEGGGMNMVSADGYEPADDKRMERVVKDAFMSAGRAVDSLLLTLEADAKGRRLFTGLWSKAGAFWLHKDLLFQTAAVLNEYLDIKGERMAYVQLVRDIRFCQNTYLKPRIGGRLLKAVVAYANEGLETGEDQGQSEGQAPGSATADTPPDPEVYEELTGMLRQALAFYVESRRTTITNTTALSGSGTRGSSNSFLKDEKLARRDSMTDAQQAMAMACRFIEENLDRLGEPAVGTPIYNAAREMERQAEQDAEHREQAECRRRREMCEQNSKKLFTGFPHTHRTPEHK